MRRMDEFIRVKYVFIRVIRGLLKLLRMHKFISGLFILFLEG